MFIEWGRSEPLNWSERLSMVGQEGVKDISLPRTQCLKKHGGMKKTHLTLDRTRASVWLNGSGQGRKRLERDTEEGEQGGGLLKAMFQSSQEGEIPQCLNGQENHLKIAAFWVAWGSIFCLKRQILDRQKYGKAFSTREMKWIMAQRPEYTGILPFLVKALSLFNLYVCFINFFSWSISH